MNVFIKTSWESSSIDPQNKGGIGKFEIPGQLYSIKFESFEDYFFIVKAMAENAKMAKRAELNGIKSEISVLIDSAIRTCQS